MEDLLPYYERELAFLRTYAGEFAERYPKIAGRLMMVGDVSEDPHVEHLVQSFALLGARISKKIEDDYPEFTEALLEVLYPHYLKPFPSCSIAQFDFEKNSTQIANCVVLPRGTQLKAKGSTVGDLKFRTVYDVQFLPLTVSNTRFRHVPEPPLGTQLPSGASAQLSIEFELYSANASMSALGVETVRFFTDGEPSLCAVLRDALAMKVCKTYVEESDGSWRALEQSPLSPVGFAQNQALVDWPARAHPAYRYLSEFFAFPEKFGFFDCDLRAAPKSGRLFKLHFILRDIPHDSAVARLLSGLSTDNIRLHCAPVINLFYHAGQPVSLGQMHASYSVLADSTAHGSMEVHSIDKVVHIPDSNHPSKNTEIHPFYSLRHGESEDSKAIYWATSLNERIAEKSPGHELQISIFDTHLDPTRVGADKLSLDLTCSNRSLPTMLAYGMDGGDLELDEDKDKTQGIKLLRKPTSPLRFARDRGAHWRLISHLSLNHLSLVEGGVDSFRELLKLYDLQRSAISARHISGIVELTHKPATLWLSGKYFSSLVKGTEIRLVIDEEHYVGIGLHIFTQVLDHFFGLYVHINSFAQLVLVSRHTGEEILRCQPRSGESILL